MRKILFTAIAALCLLAGGDASAQDHPLKADIPFAFCVGNTALPAGTYLISKDAASDCAIVVRNHNTGEAIFSFGKTDDYFRPESSAKLIFQRYGNQYFLREIHGPFRANNMMLSVSELEKKAQQQLGTVQVFERITIPPEVD